MMKHQLAAILYADVVGYSRLTELDEETTHKKLDASLNLLTNVITAHGGQAVHEAGDALLAEFQSVMAAVDAAADFQVQMAERDVNEAKDKRLEFRIGINLGEVIHDRDDIYGDGVNLAARIEGLAEPGGVCVSGSVYEQVQSKTEHTFEDLGYQRLKNITQSVRVYALKLSQISSSTVRGVFFDTLTDTRPVTSGGCLCGEIRFEIKGKDIGTTYCHCRMCQRFAGAPASAGTGFLKDDLQVTQGEPKIYTSSVIAQRAFCPTCGSSLWMSHFDLKWVFVKTLSLDNPQHFAPTAHFGIESQIPWHEIHDQLPRVSCDDSPEISALWESAGVSSLDPPRNTKMKSG